MPVGIDVGGISLSEGLRAAVASGLVVLLSVWLQSFPLLLAAFAASLTCFCDAGGPPRGRVRALLAFTVLGAAAWVGFGLLRNLPWPVVVPLAGAAVFLCSMARVWGAAAQAVGNVLIVTVALALDAPLGGREALVLGTSFVGGGLWSVVLTLALWRIYPGRAVTRAVDDVWDSLAALARDLRARSLAAGGEAAWDAHARAHRRATRIVVDEARRHVVAAAQARGPVSAAVRRAVIRLDAAETVFAALVGLGDVLEGGAPATRAAGAQALRLLRPIMTLWGKGAVGAPDRFEPLLETVEREGDGTPVLAALLRTICEALRVMARVTAAADVPEPARGAGGEPSKAAVERLLCPLRENLTWRSAILRHGVRATALTVPALAWSLIWWSPYAHWLTITVALTMQPYFAATWQRVLERVGGTLLGGLIGAAVAFLPETGLSKAMLLVPLCVIGFSVRQVSYGAYIACLTPLVVVLFDVAEPGHSDATIAAMRFGYTVAGGGLAVAASLLLWPSWDSRRLRQEVAGALAAYADLAGAVFDGIGRHDAAVEAAARQNAGVASNNLEAALSRALQEPRRVREGEVEAGLVVDAALRRLGAALLAFRHEATGTSDDPAHWSRWVREALTGLATRRPAGPPPAAPPDSTLARIRRAVLVIDAAWAGATGPDRTAVREPPSGLAPQLSQAVDAAVPPDRHASG